MGRSTGTDEDIKAPAPCALLGGTGGAGVCCTNGFIEYLTGFCGAYNEGAGETARGKNCFI